MTPSGSRVDQRSGKAPVAATKRTGSTEAGHHVAPSSRYTPRADHHQGESPAWVPILMLALFVVGGLAIMSRYLIWDSSNIPMIIGLVCLLGGLYTATKWR